MAAANFELRPSLVFPMSVVIHPAYNIDHPPNPFWLPPSPPTACILIYHPHPVYQNNNSILRLLMWDKVEGSEQRGIHYGTLVTACTIVTGNRDGAYLTRSRDGTDRLVPADVTTADAWDHVILWRDTVLSALSGVHCRLGSLSSRRFLR
jgi:hypothetical protein